MFSCVSSVELPLPARNADTQGLAYSAAQPAVSRVGNVAGPAGARPKVPDCPVTHVDQSGEVGADMDDVWVSGNRGLRAAYAYGQVMCLLKYRCIGRPDDALLERIACGLRDAIRTGSVPSIDTFADMYDAREACDPARTSYNALSLATTVVSDNENPSLNALSDTRLHLAHVVQLAVLAADASNDWQNGSSASAEVIRGLRACLTLADARRYLDKSMVAMSLAGEGHRWLELARDYLQACLSNPELKPNRFPVDPLWKSAMKEAIDKFFPAN